MTGSPPTRPARPLVRDGRDDDADQLIALMAAVFAEYPGCVLDVDGEEPDLRAIATFYRGYDGRFWVAEHPGDGRIVAMVGGRPLNGGPHWELKKLYVDSRCRGAGVGRLMVGLVEQEALRQGAPVLELWSDTRFLDARHRPTHCVRRFRSDRMDPGERTAPSLAWTGCSCSAAVAT